MASEEQLAVLLQESIGFELAASELYAMYSDLFPEDREFWWRLSMEEQNHAAILKSGMNFIKVGRMSKAALFHNLESLRNVTRVIRNRIEEYKASKPARQDAYRYAHALENSAVEAHYQKLMENQSDDKIVQIFQKLGGHDRDHATRILRLIEGAL